MYRRGIVAPKWFDKNPDLSNEDNFDQLRASLRTACRTYLAFGTAFPPPLPCTPAYRPIIMPPAPEQVSTG